MSTSSVSPDCIYSVSLECRMCFRVIAYIASKEDAPKDPLCPFCNVSLGPTHDDHVVDRDQGIDWDISYREYLQTPRWQVLRTAIIEQFRGRCAVCNSAKNLQVHHREYPAVYGTEEQWQLTLLCRNCHGLFHRYSKVRIMQEKL